MYLFLFLLFPLSFGVYCFVKRDREIIPASFIGFFAGVLICAIKLFFMYAHRIVPYSFLQNFLYYFFRQAFLPVVLLYGLFFLISKDPVEYKIKNFLPLVICFYMSFLPYSIMSASDSVPYFYCLFIKPVVYLSMVFTLSILVRHIYGFALNKKIPFIVAAGGCVLFVLVSPALIESFYIIGGTYIFVLLLALVYCSVPAATGIIKLIKYMKNK